MAQDWQTEAFALTARCPMRPTCRIAGLSLALAAAQIGLTRQAGDPEFKLTAGERKLIELTNAERKKEDLPPLAINLLLCKVARAHSQNMAKQEKLQHDLDDKTPFDRLDDAKYEFRRAAENILQHAVDSAPADMLKLWMDSETHRANILNDGFTEIGLGFAKNDKGELYVTQVLAAPLKKEK
jgi:uncharacterized protein YkwD